MKTFATNLSIVLGAALSLTACKGGLGALTGGKSLPSMPSSGGGGGGASGGGASPMADVADTAASAGKPAFCKGWKATRSYALSTAKEEYEKPKSRYAVGTFIDIQRVACDKPHDKDAALALRDEWLKATGLSEADAADAQSLMAENDAMPPADNFKLDGQQLANLSPLDQVAYLDTALHYAPDGVVMEAAWYLDAFPQGPSTLARLRFTELCLGAIRNAGEDEVEGAALFAVCANDAHALDRAKLDAELDAAKPDPATRFSFRARLGGAQATIAKLDGDYAKLAKDGGYKKLIFDLPKAGRAEWQKAIAADPAFATLLTVEDAGRSESRDALAGCHDKLWPAWEARVGKLDAKASLDVADEIIRTPEGYALGLGLAICHKDDKTNDILSRVLSDALNHASDWQGERVAVYQYLVHNANKIEFDKKGKKFDAKRLPRFSGDAVAKMIHGKVSFKSTVHGVIASVTPGSDGVEVTFKSESATFPVCDHWSESDKIDHFEDGKVVYRTTCTHTKMETATNVPPPVMVPTFMAANIEAGRQGSFMTLTTEKGAPAIPLEIATGGAKDRKVVAVLGVKK